MFMVEIASPKERPVWDRDLLYQRLGNNTSVILKLLNLCLSDLPKQITSLQSAIESTDLVLTYQCAHTIKGIAANVCAEELTQLALEIEIFAQADGIHEVADLLPNFQRQYALFQQNIKSHLSELDCERVKYTTQDKQVRYAELNSLTSKLKSGSYVDPAELLFIRGLLPAQDAEVDELLDILTTAVTHFDSEQALAALAKLLFIAKLDIAL
jgi:HPt (histidine-containing phosphotransfer) domain-containing protein